MRNRLYFPEALTEGAELELSKETAHYIGRVLRLAPDDQISLFNGDDGEWSAVVLEIKKQSARVQLEHALPDTAESELQLHLVQGVSRGDRMDFVVQKATELGVQHITPVVTHHGMVRLDAKRADKRRAHWESIAQSACEQCGRTRPPVIDAPIALNDWFGQNLGAGGTQVLMLPTASLRFADLAPPEDKLCLLVGPEGGLSDKEVDDAVAAGFQSVAMGPRVLRTETAAIAALTIAQTVWGDI
jgi:16S rRNA (uracil1498-N3)-methyltransferase